VWIFFIFLSSKIHVRPTDVVSSFSSYQCRLSSGRRRHTSFLLSQAELMTFTSSSGNILSRWIHSWTETKVLNPHHRRRLSSSDRLTSTLHCYKKIISIFDYSLHRSTASLFYFLHIQSTITSELHSSSLFPFIGLTSIIYPHNDTHGNELGNLLSLLEQLIVM
jgi:hypothetical protein